MKSSQLSHPSSLVKDFSGMLPVIIDHDMTGNGSHSCCFCLQNPNRLDIRSHEYIHESSGKIRSAFLADFIQSAFFFFKGPIYKCQKEICVGL